MGFMDNLRDADQGINTRSGMQQADTAMVSNVIALMQLGYPKLDQKAAQVVVDRWLKKYGMLYQ